MLRLVECRRPGGSRDSSRDGRGDAPLAAAPGRAGRRAGRLDPRVGRDGRRGDPRAGRPDARWTASFFDMRRPASCCRYSVTPLSAWFLLVFGLIAIPVTVYSVGYFAHAIAPSRMAAVGAASTSCSAPWNSCSSPPMSSRSCSPGS